MTRTKQLEFLTTLVQKYGLPITSTDGGTHNVGSKHYQGLAIDTGVNGVDDKKIALWNQQLQPQGYRILDERTRPAGQKVWTGPHLHWEYFGQGNPPQQQNNGAPKMASTQPQSTLMNYAPKLKGSLASLPMPYPQQPAQVLQAPTSAVPVDLTPPELQQQALYDKQYMDAVNSAYPERRKGFGSRLLNIGIGALAGGAFGGPLGALAGGLGAGVGSAGSQHAYDARRNEALLEYYQNRPQQLNALQKVYEPTQIGNALNANYHNVNGPIPSAIASQIAQDAGAGNSNPWIEYFTNLAAVNKQRDAMIASGDREGVAKLVYPTAPTGQGLPNSTILNTLLGNATNPSNTANAIDLAKAPYQIGGINAETGLKTEQAKAEPIKAEAAKTSADASVVSANASKTNAEKLTDTQILFNAYKEQNPTATVQDFLKLIHPGGMSLFPLPPGDASGTLDDGTGGTATTSTPAKQPKQKTTTKATVAPSLQDLVK